MIRFSEKPFQFVAGWFLVLLGIVGLFLPVLQGIALIIAGFIVLENEHMLKIMRKMKEKWKKRR